MIKKAFQGLSLDKDISKYNVKLRYSKRFKPFNANVKLKGKEMVFSLSERWKGIDEEIVIGLLQVLIKKIMKVKKETFNINLYNSFIKKIPEVVPKNNVDERLEESFKRVNEEYFNGLIDKTNLVWGSSSISKLGSYDLHTDTITISSFFKELPIRFLDYVMYHEMLHKKHKFKVKGERNYFHTRNFKEEERCFEEFKRIEKELEKLIESKRKSKEKESFFDLVKKKIYK